MNEYLTFDFEPILVSNNLEEENKVLKEKIKNLELNLETQKSLTTHYEGIASIMSAELKKVLWVEGMSKSARISDLLKQFETEMKGFMADKEQFLLRFSRLENLYYSIVAILK